MNKTKLCDACILITDGTHFSPPDIEEGIPFLSVKDMSDFGLDFINCSKISEEEFQSAKHHNCAPIPGDVLFSKDGTVGKVHVVIENQRFAVLSSIAIIRPNPILLDSKYLGHVLRSEELIRQSTRSKTGTALRRIIVRDIKRLEIPLPPLPEQKRIAAILDKADTMRQKRCHTIRRLDDLLHSIFLDMFGDPVINPKAWNVLSIDNMCDLVRGSSPRPRSDPRFYGGPIPRLMVADLTRDGYFVTPQIDSLTEEGAKKSRPIKKGTVVMAVSGNVGLTAILNIDACIHDGFVAFKDLDPRVTNPKYFLFCMSLLKQTHETRKDGAIFQNLTTKGIKAMQVPIPPLNLQNKWDNYFNKLLSVLDIYEHSYSTLENLFHSLQLRAFKGELTSLSDTD